MINNEHRLSEVKSLLEEAVRMRIGSGMAAAWGGLDSHSVAQQIYFGKESHFGDSVVCPRTKFDLASLTKILATTSLYLKWHEQGRLDLDATYPGKHFTFRQLLNHTSGLPAWKPFYENIIQKFVGQEHVKNLGVVIGANSIKNISSDAAQRLMNVSIQDRKAYLKSLVLSEPLETSPGEKIVYSDLGFMLLAFYAESISGKSFDQVVRDEVWAGIQDCGLEYRTLTHRRTVRSGIAATEWCAWRGLLQGEVHDDNAWSVGGVSGHAGVFGTLQDVVLWVRSFVDGKIVSMNTIQEAARIHSDSWGTKRTLGFDVSSHPAFSSNAIGHLGFTGTSLWMDLDQGRFAILLTNRVHPSREDVRIRELRHAFHQSLG